jgi:hypothetical protein
MHRRDVIAWVLSVAVDILSQAKTLAELVTAAVGVGRATLSAIGRQEAGSAAAKHRIRPDVRVRHPRFRGLMSDFPVRPGCWPSFASLAARSDKTW